MKHPQKNKLTKEERQIETALGEGAYIPVSNLSREIDVAKKVAKNTTAKTKTLNVRISRRDYLRLKARAMQEGVPYQTLITSLVHKEVRS